MSRKTDNTEVDTVRRLLIAGGAGAAIWGTLISRLVNLQLMNQDKFVAMAQNNQISLVPALARRGLIFDRFGEPLATHRTSWNVYAARESVDNLPETLARIASVVELSPERQERLGLIHRVSPEAHGAAGVFAAGLYHVLRRVKRRLLVRDTIPNTVSKGALELGVHNLSTISSHWPWATADC